MYNKMQSYTVYFIWKMFYMFRERKQLYLRYLVFVTPLSNFYKSILIYIQQDATLHSLFYLETAIHDSGGNTTHYQERKQLYLQHLVFAISLSNFYKSILIYVQQDATLHSLFYLETALHVLGWYHHPSSGAQTTVSTASGICHTVTATCRYSGR
jgi:hypothetical protein